MRASATTRTADDGPDGPTADVYERLREVIVQGQLAPGARLIERDLAKRLGTSRTPVRSALQRLQQERYVTTAAGGKNARLVVAPMTLHDARELFEVVGFLEAAAARRAALLPSARRAEVVDRLSALNAALLAATRLPVPDQNEIFELDTAFHRSYVEAGAGARILALHDVVKPQAERYCRLYISALVARITDSVREHGVIIDALGGGDADATERSVQVNWRNAADRFSEVIVNLGERGTW